MTQTIDGIVYPKTIDEALNNKKFSDFMELVLPDGDRKNMFLFLSEAPTDGLKMYSRYLRPGGEREIKVQTNVTRAMVEEALRSGRSDDAKNWPPIIAQMTNLYKKFFNDKELPKLFGSKAFEEYHQITVFERMRTIMGDSDKAAKRLGVHDAYHLEQLMLAITKQDAKEIASYARLIIQDNNLKTDAKTLVKALVNRQPLATADTPPDFSGRVKVDWKKLQLCGFTDPKNKKLLAAATAFAEAVLLTDNPGLIKSYKEMMKIEPKDTLASNMNIGEMAKMFEKFKLVV